VKVDDRRETQPLEGSGIAHGAGGQHARRAILRHGEDDRRTRDALALAADVQAAIWLSLDSLRPKPEANFHAGLPEGLERRVAVDPLQRYAGVADVACLSAFQQTNPEHESGGRQGGLIRTQI
jgi:hypothetical protein